MKVKEMMRKVRYVEKLIAIHKLNGFEIVDRYEVPAGSYGNHPSIPDEIWNFEIYEIRVLHDNTFVI